MSDYMMSPARDPKPPMACVPAEFEGYSIRLARRAGGEACVFADDAASGIGSDMTQPMRAAHNSLVFYDTVLVDGRPERVRLLTRSDFLMICLQNRSPRLDNFRRQVVSILESIEDTGRYESPGAAGQIPPDAMNDPILVLIKQAEAMRLKQIEADRKADAALARAESADTKAQMAHDTVIGLHGWYALGTWAPKRAGISLSEQEAAREAQAWLVPECRRRGITPQTVHSSKFVHVNAYPEDLLWEWASDYARRYPLCGYRGRPA